MGVKIMSFELQNIDCNCNDCKFMVRDFDKFKQSTELHKKWQLDQFSVKKNNLIKKAKEWIDNLDIYNSLMVQVNKMRFVFDKSSCSINYGNCTKLNKQVSFIPMTCQLETQDCFKHRKSNY